MPGLDDPILAGTEPTTLRDLAAAGRLEPGAMSHVDADDWQAGGDLFYVQDSESRDMWAVSEADWTALKALSVSAPSR